MSLQSHQIVDQTHPSSSLLQGVRMGRKGNLEVDGISFPVVDLVSVGSNEVDQKPVIHHHIHHIHHHQSVEDAHSTAVAATTNSVNPVFWQQTYASDQYNNFQNLGLQENLLELGSEPSAQLVQHPMFEMENDFQMAATPLMVGSEMNMAGNVNANIPPNYQMSQSMNGLNAISTHQSLYINSDQVTQTPALPMPSSANGGNASTGVTAVKPKTRAKRGQATDPHSIAERLRREKISERMKNLQQLVPNSNKTDKASMLDEIIEYVKFLQVQLKVLSMSRLGSAGTVVPFISDNHSDEFLESYGLGELEEDSSEYEETMAFEEELARLLDSDIATAMQYLQAKGLCLMPTSLASAISSCKGSSASIIPPGRNKPDRDDDDNIIIHNTPQ
ncbi:hypothetical protein ZOSMA_257G00080 [Zostera marina]|uniref:BHLH domain-containing protein n=1 Tax=Zostera marina TaxID=29655 RepID=A0A0K9PHX2_ZOSMR|nr:hypothetical protein ZOSMA_257G00080 [Zostera marina]